MAEEHGARISRLCKGNNDNGSPDFGFTTTGCRPGPLPEIYIIDSAFCYIRPEPPTGVSMILLRITAAIPRWRFH